MTASVSPENWVSTNLGSILELKYGKSLPAKDRDDEGAPVYGSNGIVGLHSSPFVQRGGIVVGRKGSFGEVHISTKPFSPIDTTYYIDETWGLPLKYWYYQLRCLPLTQLNRSSAIPGLNREDAYAQGISLPPLVEQQQIATRLDALLAQVDTLKTRLDAIPAIFNRFRQSVLAAAVSGRLTEGEFSVSENILSGVTVKITDGEHITPKTTSDGVPLLSAKDVQEGELLFDDCKYVSRETADKALSRCKPEAGDVLIVSRGATVGRTHLVKVDREFCLMGSVLLIKVDTGIIDPSYMAILFREPFGQKQLIATSGSSAQQAIYIRDVKNFALNLPNMSTQKEIVCRVEQLFAFADQIEKRVKEAQSRVNQLTQSILAKGFRGELTTEWRAQNPDLISGENSAEALLARIKTEKVEAVRAKKTNQKSVKTKAGKNMMPKMIIPVAIALKAAGTPLAAQTLLTQSGYSSDATTEDLERFFLDIRDQLKLGSILRERSGDDDIFTLVN